MRTASGLLPLLALLHFCNVAAVTLRQPSAIKADSSPIAKVVTLITEMKSTIEKEATADEEAYDKYTCWSETNEKQKNEAIEAATQSVQQLEAFVEEAAGTKAQLSTEISGLEADIGEDQSALDSANSQREKESEEFQAEEADMKETIGLLEQGIAKLQEVQLLQKHGKNVPVKLEGEMLLQVQNLAKRVHRHPHFNSVMQKDLFDVLGSLEEAAHKDAHGQGAALLFQNLRKPNDLKGGSAGAKSYNSRSGPILGILVEQKDQFNRDLSKAQKEDFVALVNFQKLSAAKTSEIAAATQQKEMKEGQLADLLNKVAQSKESIESSNDSLTSDNEFLQNLLKNRKSEDMEHTARVKTRSDEIQALGETLEILTGDESRALFGKTISFLQAGASTSSREVAQERAMKRLMDVGHKHNNMALVALAMNVKLDAFTKVKESMGKMMAALKTQQADEYEKWEGCKKEIDETEDEIKEATETKDDLGEKHQDLKNTLSQLDGSSDELKKEVSQMEVELKKAGEARKAENSLFQTSVSDQRSTVAILNMALGKLKSFYSSSLVQVVQPAPKDYSKNAGAGGVMQLLAKIITDAQVEEKQLAMSESDAQAGYAEFVKDTANGIETSREAIAEKAKQAASSKAEKSETQEAQMANKGEIEKLDTLLQGVHGGCDFLLKFFDVRQKSRSEEMDAIGEATAILSGANYGQ